MSVDNPSHWLSRKVLIAFLAVASVFVFGCRTASQNDVLVVDWPSHLVNQDTGQFNKDALFEFSEEYPISNKEWREIFDGTYQHFNKFSENFNDIYLVGYDFGVKNRKKKPYRNYYLGPPSENNNIVYALFMLGMTHGYHNTDKWQISFSETVNNSDDVE